MSLVPSLLQAIVNLEGEALVVHVGAADRPAFLALLKRQGIDTSFAERLA
jgi:hypothetical protein